MSTSAADRRAARRARVLGGGESRLKLVTGEISSLKAEDQLLDDGVAELIQATDEATNNEPKAVHVPQVRVDPAQRRRDAAARREKAAKLAEQILRAAETSHKPAAEQPVVAAKAETKAETASEAVSVKETTAAPATFRRHTLALTLHTVRDHAIRLLLVAAAVYVVTQMNVSALVSDAQGQDQLFTSYQQLVAQGVPLDAIRQQMERENLEGPVVDQIEQLFARQRKTELPNVSFASNLVPNFLDLPRFFASLLEHPPILLCVLLVRVVVAALAGALHVVLRLPEVKQPQEDDLGMVVNLLLSSRPAFKHYVVQARKSMDDLFFFLYVLVLLVASRVLWLAYQ